MFGIIEAAILAASLSADSLAAGFAYGSKGIRIPAASLWVVNLVCCGVVAGAMLLGHVVRPVVSAETAAGVGFAVLFVMGLVKLLDGAVKNSIKRAVHNREFDFSAFDIRLVLHIYANPEAADADTSACLSPGEAVALAVALSLDGMAVGFAAVLAGVNPWALLGWSFVLNAAGLVFGQRIGRVFSRKLPFNISWAGGVVLILLAFWRLLA